MESNFQEELNTHRDESMHGTVLQPAPERRDASRKVYDNYYEEAEKKNKPLEEARKRIVLSAEFNALKAFIPSLDNAVKKEQQYEKELLSNDAPLLLSNLIVRVEKIQAPVAEKFEDDKEKWYSFFPGVTTDPARSQVIDKLLLKLHELQNDMNSPTANKPVLFKGALDAVSAAIGEIRASFFGANSKTAEALEKVRTHIQAYKEYEDIKPSVKAPTKR